MATVTTLRPTSLGTAILSAGIIQANDTAGAIKYFIKIRRARILARVKVADITGDNDTGPNILPSLHEYITFAYQGVMLSANAPGFASLRTSSSNPGTTAMKFNFDASRSITALVTIEQLAFDWDRTGVFVGMAMRCHATVNTTTGVDTIVEG